MQDAFGCAVENRFFQLLDDESDPLDFLHQASADLGHKKKKKDEAAAKKAVPQKSSKKESQKERKTTVTTVIEAPGSKRDPKPPVQKECQNENIGKELKVERPERRTAFQEFRSNVLEKPMEYSIDNFEKEKQVRNWVANQGTGTRSRGFPQFSAYDSLRGKREFDRHSGSNKARVRAEDKRGGSGSHNWGSFKDDCSDLDQTPMDFEALEPPDTQEEQHIQLIEETVVEDFGREMSLDEWKSLQDQARPKAEFNLRKPETAVPSKAVVIHKSKYVNNEKMGDDEDYHCGFRKPVNDITSQLDINFGSLTRPGRGGRGGGRGRARREETPSSFFQEVHNVQEFYLNPDDPEDFPALM